MGGGGRYLSISNFPDLPQFRSIYIFVAGWPGADFTEANSREQNAKQNAKGITKQNAMPKSKHNAKQRSNEIQKNKLQNEISHLKIFSCTG